MLIVLEVLFNMAMGIVLSGINVPENYTAPVLDMRLFNTLETFKEYFSVYTSVDRSKYFFMQIIDMFYPLVYGGLIASVIFKLSSKYYLVLLPVIAVFFDYIENIFLINANLSYPAINFSWLKFVTIITFVKWVFIYISVFVIILYFIKQVIIKK